MKEAEAIRISRRIVVSATLVVCGLCVVKAQESSLVQITPAFSPDAAQPENTAIARLWVNNIYAAQHSLRLTFYDFTLLPIRDALIAAKQLNPALDIRGILDRSQIASANVYAVACQAGAQFKYWDPQNRVDLVHHKFMIIDGDDDHPTVITGSANVTNTAVRFNHENQSAFTFVDGSRAFFDAYVTQFERMWSNQFDFPPNSPFRDYVPDPPCQ
jgi:phosphatidylserine/phosphatidylglycerophosphate/cardiolipin synthase-like enzyme